MNDAELRLALVLDANGDGLWEFLPDEGLVLLHPAFLALLGYPPRALGEPVDQFFERIHEDERRALIIAVFEADAPFEVCLRIRHADGNWRWHRARGRSIRNRVIVVQSDISSELQNEAAMADAMRAERERETSTARDLARRRQEALELLAHRDHLEALIAERTAELEQARVRAEDKAEAKAAFLANMSHEIRTPMNAVIGLTRLTLRTALDHRQRDYLERISGAGKLLLGLINDVLDYSKIEADRLELEQAPFVLDEVLDTVATLVGGRAHEKGLEFHYLLDAGVPHRLVGDALRLTQVLVNLCSNALKFTSSGHVVVRVGADLIESSRGRFSFSIEDTGIGLTPEQAGRLFSAFSQADVSTARRYGGTGLGLMISRRLVQLMGGEIRLISAPGQGTTFYFDVDLGYETGDAVRSSIPDEIAGQSVRIVDDHALAGDAIASALTRLGMLADIHTAVPPPGMALPFADSVIIDADLPGARDYIARLRATSPAPGLPRIVLLAGVDIEACEAAVREWGADDCLTKPVTVVRLLRALVGERRTQPEPVGRYDDMRGHRVLVVDDIAVNRLIMAETLGDWGLSVDEAESAEQALGLVLGLGSAQRGHYSAILMDVQMPGMDGTDATRRLRAEGYLNPVIALTGHSLDAERERCRAAGMADVITKPIDPDRLAHVLRSYLPPLPPDTVQAVLREAAEKVVSETGASTILDAVLPAPTSGLPAHAEGIDALPGIDTDSGLRRMQGKIGLYEKVLRSFLGRFAQADDTIAVALREGRRDDAEREAHSLKGLAANIGADALSESAGSVEFAIRDRQPSEWPVAALTLELAQVIVGLRDRFQ